MKNAKLRILFVITQAEWGGAQSYCVRATQEAVRRGHEVLMTAGGDGELKNACEKAGIPYQKLDRMEREIRPLKDLGAIRELRALFRSWKPDVVYLHSSKAGIVGSIAGRLARVPRIVYRIAGWSFLDPVSRLQKTLRIWSERLTARFKDVIITLHPDDRARADTYHITPKERIVMIPNALDLASFDARLLPRDEARAALDDLWEKGIASGGMQGHANGVPLPSGVPLLLTIANFYATKDLVRYMDAIARVTETHPDIRVLILGDGQLRQDIEKRRSELHLESVVSLPGMHRDASRLLKGADLFVLPSAKEGMPWTVLEAMAAGLPCVATDVGACKWMLSESGWIVPPKQPEQLAKAIISALEHPDWAAEAGTRARAEINIRFREEQMWDDTFAVLEEPPNPLPSRASS